MDNYFKKFDSPTSRMMNNASGMRLHSSSKSINTGASSSQIYFGGGSRKSNKSTLNEYDEEYDEDYEFSKIPETNKENIKSAKVGELADVESSYYYLSENDAERIRYLLYTNNIEFRLFSYLPKKKKNSNRNKNKIN